MLTKKDLDKALQEVYIARRKGDKEFRKAFVRYKALLRRWDMERTQERRYKWIPETSSSRS